MLDDKQRHFPADPNHFAFDSEVSRVFPDMAVRSIPNFQVAHDTHARMVAALTVDKPHVKVLDIGASRGHFIKALAKAVGDTYAARFWVTAYENSQPMREYLGADHPEVDVLPFDLATDPIPGEYDVIVLHYVLQFLPREVQHEALQKVLAALRPGGILVFGHKSAHHGSLGAVAHDAYIDFRVQNGYTRAEIEAKTKALAGSMHCADHHCILDDIKAACSQVEETFRFMMFSTLIAVK